MEILNLPKITIVNRVIPKNTFDSYTSTKQKRLFTEKISRITWKNKLSPLTTNLRSVDIEEIQIFLVELKVQDEIPEILEVIDRAIPYPIVFIIKHEDQEYFATSAKHSHPTNPDNMVIDWIFRSDWLPDSEALFSLDLRKNLDHVHKDFILQLSGRDRNESKSIKELVEFQQTKFALEKEIGKLKTQISGSKQYKKKVELNMQLKDKEKELKNLK